MALRPSPLRVLVIDDDEMSRELLAVLLAGEGYAVDSAESGEAALNHLHHAGPAPDLVLTDIQLPGICGSELAASLRKVCEPGCVLLAISGSQPTAESISTFDGFLLKPFSMTDVAAAFSSAETHTAAAPRRVLPASNVAMNALAPVEDPDSRTADGPRSPPVLDEQIFNRLTGAMLPSQMREMYQLCTDDARSRIASMRELVIACDGLRFIREAHAIKGGAGMLGASELHRLATDLETRGLSAGSQGAEQDVNSLDELSAACDRLERMLGSRL